MHFNHSLIVAKNILANIDLTKMPCPMQITLWPNRWKNKSNKRERYLFQLEARVKDRQTGKPISLYSWLPYNEDKDIIPQVFDFCRWFIDHEMKETFYYNNNRIYDPHH